jgi:hypothetical protein
LILASCVAQGDARAGRELQRRHFAVGGGDLKAERARPLWRRRLGELASLCVECTFALTEPAFLREMTPAA